MLGSECSSNSHATPRAAHQSEFDKSPTVGPTDDVDDGPGLNDLPRDEDEDDADVGNDTVLDNLVGGRRGTEEEDGDWVDESDEEEYLRGAGAMAVLRRGLAVTPELKQGLILTVLLAILTAAGKLAIPILIQQILAHGVLGDEGYRPGFVAAACGFATGSNCVVERTIPANMADCGTVNWSAVVLKYVRAAAEIPYAPLPQKTMLR